MATMAAGFEGVDFARARAAQAVASPANWSLFPATIERRPKSFRWGSNLLAFISANDFQGGHSSKTVSHVVALAGWGTRTQTKSAVGQVTDEHPTPKRKPGRGTSKRRGCICWAPCRRSFAKARMSAADKEPIQRSPANLFDLIPELFQEWNLWDSLVGNGFLET